MAEVLLNLSPALWKNEICPYLTPPEVLSLRTLSKQFRAFITALLLELGAVKSASVERLMASEAVQRGAARARELEPLREVITGASIQGSELAMMLAFANPPEPVMQVLQLVVGLKAGKANLPWKSIAPMVRSPTFISDLMSFFQAPILRKVPPALLALAGTLRPQQMMAVSRGCAVLTEVAQAFLELQEGYRRAGAEEWLSARKLAEEVSKECKMYEKVVQGMPESVWEQRRAVAKKAGAKKAGEVEKKVGGVPKKAGEVHKKSGEVHKKAGKKAGPSSKK